MHLGSCDLFKNSQSYDLTSIVTAILICRALDLRSVGGGCKILVYESTSSTRSVCESGARIAIASPNRAIL